MSDPITESSLTGAADQPLAQSSEGVKPDTVSVKPVRSFHDSEINTFVTPDTGSLSVSRGHAVQLRANGLVEFESPDDEQAADAEETKKTAEVRATRNKQQGIADKDKSTPLKNPKLNY